MKHLHALCFTTTILLTTLTYTAFSQCNINTCGVIFTADDLFFDADQQALKITNINWGKLSCYTTNLHIGIDVYIYQHLPNGSRSEDCQVLNPYPDNVTGYVNLDFGSNVLCNYEFLLDTISIGSNDGFYPCDGALYEVEMALYVTVDESFLNSTLTANNHLHANEYIMLNMGTVETHISNTFPGNGQPLLINEISPWGATHTDTLLVNCYQDVALFLHGQSLLANCDNLTDYTEAIISETSNIFIYSVDGGAPQMLTDPNMAFSGGPQTGAQTNGHCYGGILTHTTPYIFNADKIQNPCNGTTVELSLYTNDAFTNQLKTSSLTLIYGESCVNQLTLNDIPLPTNVYQAGQLINSKGTVVANDTVLMKAGQRISLKNGFKVQAGSKYRAEIAPCD